ncbi:long-chain fatty acid transporter [Fulvimarina endophytica]|uniref:Long-chain fatty acid transporter n=1 Tax=Fulvimarina endophytica TaxID=2293836 RepID=A0A371X0R4_9HYPH|nr:outer membrane protein transport protein [Fulvimarina endophytica]RFC62830.1 long-chain fatty acid transporter [Fulvimarina endophytica]
MTRTTKTIIGGALATTLLASSALAAGFQRGSPETDVLFAPGTVSIHTGYTYVNPERGFETINGQSGNFGDYTQKYLIPSLAIAFGGEPFSCAAHYTESFAAEADYSGAPGGSLPFQVSSTQSTRAADRVPTLNPGATALSRTQRIEFDSNEFGTTCRVSYTSDAGRFSVLGGLFLEDFNFQGTSFGFTGLNNQFAASGPAGAGLARSLNAAGLQAFLPTQVDSDVSSGYSTGYRIGLAYEYPDIALRAQVMYRSEVDHDDIVGTANVAVLGNAFAARGGQEVALGQLSNVVAGAGLTAASAVGQLNSAGAFKSSLSDVTSPQYLDIKLQTGIAEDTLLLASFRWTDWSTNNAVVNTISSPLGQTSSYQPYFWDDGYTASLGLGRAFTDRVSGAVSVGYDSGVSSGAETTYTDLYTLSAGMSLKGSEWAELRFGGLIGYWTDGSQSIGEGAYFNGTVGDDVVYAGNASLKFTW